MKMTNKMLRQRLNSETEFPPEVAPPVVAAPARRGVVGKTISSQKIDRVERARIAKQAFTELMANVKDAIKFGGSFLQADRTTFRPELCDMLISVMANTGCTTIEALQILGIHKQTSVTWEKYPEWVAAQVEGQIQAEAWWWRCGRVNLSNPYFNNTLYIYQTANRFHLRRQDPVRIEGAVDVNNKSETKILNVNVLRQLSDDQLKVLESIGSTILTVPENGAAPRLSIAGQTEVVPTKRKIKMTEVPVEEEVE